MSTKELCRLKYSEVFHYFIPTNYLVGKGSRKINRSMVGTQVLYSSEWDYEIVDSIIG